MGNTRICLERHYKSVHDAAHTHTLTAGWSSYHLPKRLIISNPAFCFGETVKLKCNQMCPIPEIHTMTY